MNFKTGVFLGILLVPCSCLAQADNEILISRIMEYIAESRDEDLDYSEIAERLNFYREHPLNINKVDREQLKSLVFLSPVHVNKLISHREENGLFQNILELQSLEGFDEETVRWLASFLKIDPPELLKGVSLNSLLNKSEHDLIVRFGRILERQAGFLASGSGSPAYSGSALRVLTRYRYSYANKLLASLNMEKDAGESFLKNSGRGFDFYSANLFLKGERFVRKFIAGDYSLQFGEGLTMWSGLGFGKGASLTNFAKQDMGLRPYSSVNESSVLRGFAATVAFKKLTFTPFISYKKLDASLSDDRQTINSLTISGLHRSDSEIENKNNATQLVYGLNSRYTDSGLTLGFTAYRTKLDRPVAEGRLLYEKYDFSGRSLTNIGIHYSYTFKNTYFFGEAAHSLSSGSAFLNGLLSSISDKVSIAVLYRTYARNYQSFFNQGLSESTNAVNEKGLCSGLTIKFPNRLELSGYFDLFRFPWLKFRVDAPSHGYEFFAQLVYSFDKRFKVSGRFRQQFKEENAEGLSVAGGLDDVVKQNYRLEINYKVSSSFTLRNRVEVSRYEKGVSGSEYGFVSYQDVIYDPLNSRLSGNFRFGIFDTQGFNSRIYSYENDVLYGYSVPAYQGKGLRMYINGRYTIKRGVDIWLRYAVQSLTSQETVGSGYDMINGNKRSDVKLQIRFQF